jgi:peptidyl-prolyl cis-trans isomerase A (cyclophilin A)
VTGFVRAVLVAAIFLVPACGRGDRKAQLDPSRARARAPQTFRVKFDTTKGSFLVDVYRDWAPHSADRFFNLVGIGFYDGCSFFRMTPLYAQFGLSGDKDVTAAWLNEFMPVDRPKQSNRQGFLSFAQAGSPERRSTQVFVNRVDNTHLDREFAPFGQIVGDGMKVVDALYAGYGDGPPDGPVQGRIVTDGKAYLDREFPKLDRIKRATIVR